MAVKRYENGAWVDVSAIRRFENGAWKDVGFGRRYENGAWVDVWPIGIKIGESISDYVREDTRARGSTTQNVTTFFGHLETIPSPGIYTINVGEIDFTWFGNYGASSSLETYIRYLLIAIDVDTGAQTEVCYLGANSGWNSSETKGISKKTIENVQITTKNSKVYVAIVTTQCYGNVKCYSLSMTRTA